MPQIKLPGHIDLNIDFDDLRFENHGFNYQVAKEISAILMANLNIDDLRGLYNDDGPWTFDSTVGTGGSMNMRCANLAQQRALLASHLSSYAKRQYNHCYLSVYEYRCLKELLIELRDDGVAPHRERIHNEDIALLQECCQQFAKELAEQDPTFLMEVIKESAE